MSPLLLPTGIVAIVLVVIGLSSDPEHPLVVFGLLASLAAFAVAVFQFRRSCLPSDSEDRS